MSDQASRTEIDAILHDLQTEIRRHRVALGESGTLDPPDPLAQVRERQRVNSHLPIGWPVMPKGIWPKMVAYTQKIIRRLLRWYINPLVEQQNAFNAAVTVGLADVVNRQTSQDATFGDLVQRLERLEGTVRDLLAFRKEMGDLAVRTETVEDAVRGLQATRDRHAETFQAMQDVDLRGEKGWKTLLSWQEAREQREEVLRVRLQRLEDWQRQERQPREDAPSTVISQETSGPGPDYFLLGLEHRSASQIAERLSDYDDLFSDLLAARERGEAPSGPIVDIGCGRGEFVEHLQGLGLTAYGIEIDGDAVLAAQQAGRDVREAEALAHLHGLPDDSLAGAVLIQVIEHFTAEDLLVLFRLIRHKLAPGGLLLAETINPLVFAALSSAYLLDPSHETPLHPAMTRFLLEQAGLERVEFRFLRPVPAPTRLEPLPSEPEDPLVRTLNDNVERLNALLYGPQDYAAIAWKPED